MALNDAGSSEQLTAICQGFIGSGIAGEALLMFHDSEIADIAQLMQRQSRDYSDLEMLLDLSSVLIGACVSSIAEQIDVVFSQGQIGRASCRARVCKYVESSVVAGQIK